ncbi:MAG: phosphonate monoester hydrolase, partial [Pseudomonadota bacterium]
QAEGFRPMLFDLASDPQEFRDLGDSNEHAPIREKMREHLFTWARRPSQRTTRSDSELEARRAGGDGTGVLIGVDSAQEVSSAAARFYTGKPGMPRER